MGLEVQSNLNFYTIPCHTQYDLCDTIRIFRINIYQSKPQSRYFTRKILNRIEFSMFYTRPCFFSRSVVTIHCMYILFNNAIVVAYKSFEDL